MAEGYIEYKGWLESFEASEMATFWHLLETRLRVSAPTVLKTRLLDVIEDQRLYMDYGLVVDLDPLVGGGVTEFLEVLNDVMSFVKCSPSPHGESFYQTFFRPEVACAVSLAAYPEGTHYRRILWPTYQVYVLVASLNERTAPLLNTFGWASTEHPIKWAGPAYSQQRVVNPDGVK